MASILYIKRVFNHTKKVLVILRKDIEYANFKIIFSVKTI